MTDRQLARTSTNFGGREEESRGGEDVSVKRKGSFIRRARARARVAHSVLTSDSPQFHCFVHFANGGVCCFSSRQLADTTGSSKIQWPELRGSRLYAASVRNSGQEMKLGPVRSQIALTNRRAPTPPSSRHVPMTMTA